MKRSLLEKYQVKVVTQAAQEPDASLMELYQNNAGKPIVGIQSKLKSGCRLANLSIITTTTLSISSTPTL